MKKKLYRLSAILVVVAVVLIWITSVVAAEKTKFSCTETVLGLADPGEVTFPNGHTHIRGATLLADEWATDPRLIGLNTIVLNANVRPDGTGRMWGTFHIENEDGGWEGTYAGEYREETYNAVADGYGAYAGLKMWWNMRPEGCSGTILEH
jgi:hypothetical protein